MLIQDLKQRRLMAMKNKNTIAKDILGVLIGELQNSDAARNTDEAAERELVQNAIIDTHKRLQKALADFGGKDAKFAEKVEAELAVIGELMPQPLTEAELRQILADIKGSGISLLKDAMKQLSEKHKGRYNGKMAAELARELFQ